MKQRLFNNGTYKLVALFITLSLWVIILGRKDLVTVREIPLKFNLPQGMVLAGPQQVHAVFKVRGPRVAVKRFMKNNDVVQIDMTSAREGPTLVRLHEDILPLPQGVRVLSVSPSSLEITIRSATK